MDRWVDDERSHQIRRRHGTALGAIHHGRAVKERQGSLTDETARRDGVTRGMHSSSSVGQRLGEIVYCGRSRW
jgi:hypothetical protein